METIHADVVIVGAGGAGLRAAIAIAETDPSLEIALISKVYPMRSHTCAAEGGAAGVKGADDSLEMHFNDTVSGGDWLCDQEVVEYFVSQASRELIQLEHWGCPWSREDDGSVAVRPFGGMKKKRTWYAADKSGFHILHTLFQTSLQFPSIKRYDEYFALDLLHKDGKCRGVVAMEMRSGRFFAYHAPAVIMASGGAGQVFPFTTNGAVKTGDGMAMAYRAGIPLKDMEFVQYHPTGLPGTGILLTEGCRGEGGILVNKNGYRYLQDYGMGPETPIGSPVLKTMELGPRDRLSQAFWHEQKKGNTVETPWGHSVLLDMRHLGEKKINERLPLVRELASSYVGHDPVKEPVPVRPVIHFMMGGIDTNLNGETQMPGLFAIGETACSGLHGANRLGSNSLTDLLVSGKRSADRASAYAKETGRSEDNPTLRAQAEDIVGNVRGLLQRSGGGETTAGVRREMRDSLESGAGIYRDEKGAQATCDKVAELHERFQGIEVNDKSNVFNTDLQQLLELRNLLDVAETVAEGSLQRRESRGAHQRLDFVGRDDENFLKHSLAFREPKGRPRIEWLDVTITRSQPGVRDYSGGKDK
ncbi:MAG: fumarate reductase (quinol) flavoprotein subunit [Xanthomonadales bacterium]|nr:fumarate reductase (quinol) flavoprotein subunit [Gammaproteobacteria bacterium]MBT8052239.1 fumarate reductase (quinol) flavoprotein subunit [Gammaproteobacteria bacterium]MBT8055590.1 fumarate reductase (quinol) flavoprotein subunit [Gammaproteobacteria bacterium]NNJ79084.1 fumarate reductase (quinol) flavoprotein subunit [Xanthomonadales bacterium]NNL05852.1 fumarate reductase (quinol) flavoprotein subunit [Xanthomonadales bacterium]